VAADVIERVRQSMPELPEARRRRLIEEYGLSPDDAAQLTDTRAMADFYEATAKASANPKAAANWILNELVRELKNTGADISASPVRADALGALINKIDDQTISGKMAKDALIEMYRSGKSVDEVVSEMGGGQVSNEDAIRKMARQVIASNPRQLEQYRSGKESLLGFFVGQTMKASAGRANPQVVNRVLKEILEGEGQQN
jgi:aspartyl-tRNA(Asn)/glutamyl-tRNA(Gln) amidotransferase subunit B